MKTETENLRELDAWIGVNIFGMKAISKDGPPPAGGVEEHYFVREWIDISASLPRYSTDPAAAMLVLEKCAASNAVGVQGNVSIFQEPENGRWAVFFDAAYEKHCIDPVFAETLPLAICRFAKALFSK